MMATMIETSDFGFGKERGASVEVPLIINKKARLFYSVFGSFIPADKGGQEILKRIVHSNLHFMIKQLWELAEKQGYETIGLSWPVAITHRYPEGDREQRDLELTIAEAAKKSVCAIDMRKKSSDKENFVLYIFAKRTHAEKVIKRLQKIVSAYHGQVGLWQMTIHADTDAYW